MKLRGVLVAVMVFAVLVPSCGNDDSESDGASDIPPEAAAAAEEYVRTLQEGDDEGFQAVINPAVYEYVFSDTSSGADAVSPAEGGMVVETGDEVSVQLIHTVSNTVYVAIVALRPNTEPTPVNGIMVLELSEFPDRGWLVTRDYRHGM